MAVSRSNARSTTKKTTARDANKLTTFVWRGVDKRGTKVQGEQQARTSHLLRAELRNSGITVTTIKTKSLSLFSSDGKSIKPRDIAFFSRQMATMMKSGVPIISALSIISEGHKSQRMSRLINSIRSDIEGGSSVSEAISRHPAHFDSLYTNLVRAGESAGVLETVLDTIANYQENIETLKGKIKKAMFYPVMIIFVAIAVCIGMLVFVVPQFEEMFKSFGAELPVFTQILIGISRFLTAHWFIIIAAVVAAVFGIVTLFKRSKELQYAAAKFILKVPVIGTILNNSAIARFSRTLAVTFRAGVPLIEALETISGATGSVIYRDAVLRIREDVSVGYALNASMKQTRLFPNMVVQMTAIGEEAGALDTMLFKVAEYYEQEVNNAVDALSSLIEPMIMVIIGVLVGSMVIGMYLPIFKLGSVVG